MSGPTAGEMPRPEDADVVGYLWRRKCLAPGPGKERATADLSLYCTAGEAWGTGAEWPPVWSSSLRSGGRQPREGVGRRIPRGPDVLRP